MSSEFSTGCTWYRTQVHDIPSLQHRLVMFTGSTSGVGKSTLSDFLYRQLVAHGIPSHWIYEEDFVRMDVLAEYNRRWYGGEAGTADALLDAARALFIDHAVRDEVWITDTLFPGFFWLLGREPLDCIERYGKELARLVLPLRPLIVYIDADVPTAFDRAIAVRGDEWGVRIIEFIKTWKLPYYPHALRTRDDVLRFQEWVNNHVRTLLQSWPADVLTLDTTRSSLPETQRVLLRHFGLIEVPGATLSPTVLQSFTGVYEPAPENAEAGLLIVTLKEGALFINRFWPTDCRLVPEGATDFRLAAASRRIQFKTDAAGDVVGLTYTLPNAVHRYQKRT